MPKIYGDLEFQGTARVVADNNGTALLPGITFAGDLNTGMYRHAADVLGFSTNGVLRLLINDEGALVISDVTAPGITTNKLYAVSGDLFWNGSQLNITPSANKISDGNAGVAETFIDTSATANTITSQVPSTGAFALSEPFRASAAGGVIIKSSAAISPGSGPGTAITLEAGNAGNSGSDSGGAINITGGRGAPAAFDGGGAINITAGENLGTQGGSVNILSGEGASQGGNINLTGAVGNGTGGQGGRINLTGGAAANGGSSGDGGFIKLTAGAGGTVNGDGGNVQLQGGVPAGAGNPGSILLLGPDVSTAAELRIHENSSSISEYIALRVPDNAITTSATYTLPEAPAGNGYLLASTTAGVMSWTDPSTLGASFPLLAPDGSAAAPSYSFVSDPDNGMYRVTTNTIGFAAGGNNVATIGTTGISMASGTTVLSDLATGIPTFSFVGDTDTGMGSHALGDRLEFYAGSINVLESRTTHLLPLVQTRNIDGSSGAPSYSFSSNQTTGMFKDGAVATDPIAFTVNSQESLNIESDGTLNVAAVTNYETLITLDDDIPNKKYVDDAVSAAGGTAIQLTQYTAAAGQTVFGGPDDNAVTLAYIPGQLYVYKNGVLLEDTTDYVATNGTAIVLNVATALNDVVQATAFSTITGVGASANSFVYTATASQTIFTGNDDNGDPLSYTPGDLMVYLNGVLLDDGADYTATNGTSVVLTVGATAGNLLQIFEWGSFLLNSQNNVLDQFVYTASAAQTTFTGVDDNGDTLGYTAGFIKVYLNGALLEDTTDYTATNGTSVVLISAAALNDVVQITSFGTFSVADHYTKAQSDERFAPISRSRKNAVINGNLDIWQRGTSFTSISGTFIYTADRFIFNTNDGTWDVTRSTDVPTTAQAGMQFNYSLDVDCQAIATPTLSDHINVQYRVEGYDYKNMFDQNQTISFWVKSNKTGIYSASLRSVGVDRIYVSEFTINVADTWEKKVITIDTAPTAGGTWNFTNGVGVYMDVTLASGPNIQTSSLDQWITANTAVSTNQVNLGDSTLNYLRITGLQLEKGSEATDFENSSFSDELAMCQRYYTKSYEFGTAPGAITAAASQSYTAQRTATQEYISPVQFQTTMRVTPSLTIHGTDGILNRINGVDSGNLVAGAFALSDRQIRVITATAAHVLHDRYQFHWEADAEL